MSGRLRWAAAMSAAILFACPAIAGAQGYANPVPITLNALQIEDTAGIGIEPGEPLTPPSNNDEEICTTFGPGAYMADTFWFKFTAPSGSTHDIVLSTEGSNFDTQVAVYDAPEPGSFNRYLGCSNDPFGSPFGEVVLTPVAGDTYLVQVGGCDDDVAGTCPSQPGADDLSGNAWFAALTNDDRTNPLTINPGRTTRTNVGASTDGTELTSCSGAQYGKTVWFRYTAPAEGDVTYATTVVDTVLSAYKGTTRLTCNDDAGDSNAAEIGFHVDAGQQYLIQVGGKRDGSFFNFGGFTQDLKFTEDRDHDNDGYNRNPGPDCNDNNAGIHPNAPSVTGNGVDENCDGSDPPNPVPPVDRDGDGSPAGQDCDDANKARRPGNTEIRGNGKDEDCVDGDLAFQRLPTSYGISGVWGAFGRFTRLTLRNVEAGSTVRIRCRGKGCRRKKIVRRVRKATRRLQLAKAMRRNHPRPGARVEVRVTKPGKIGKVFTYRIRNFKEPVEQTLCLPPGASRASRCRPG